MIAIVAASAMAVAPRPDSSVALNQEARRGQTLAASLGCGACHADLPGNTAIKEIAPAFGTDDAPLAPAFVFHYMADPQPVRPDIGPARMPSYALTEEQRLALALFVTSETALRGVDDAFLAARARHPDAGRETGRALFESLACVRCHDHPGAEPVLPSAPGLSGTGLRVRREWLRRYLADPMTIRPAGTLPGRGDQMPDFRLSEDEASALTEFLMAQRSGEIAPWDPQPLSPFAMQKAEVLLRDRFSCLGCHELGGDGGRIGPRLDGVGRRLQPGYLRAVIENPSSLAPATVMPAPLEHASRIDVIASFLLQRDAPWEGSDPVAGLPLRSAARPRAAATEAVYQSTCAPCHGEDGAGDGFNAAYLPVPPTVHSDSSAVSERPDDTLYDAIYAGGWVLGKSPRMPGFGKSLSDAAIRELVDYIRELCDCQGPAWSRR